MNRFDWDQLFILGICFAAVGFLIFGVMYGLRAEKAESDAWATFSGEHQCLIIERRSGFTTSGVGTVVGAGGKVGVGVTSYSTPPMAAWRCDDGVTYWRRDQK